MRLRCIANEPVLIVFAPVGLHHAVVAERPLPSLAAIDRLDANHDVVPGEWFASDRGGLGAVEQLVVEGELPGMQAVDLEHIGGLQFIEQIAGFGRHRRLRVVIGLERS